MDENEKSEDIISKNVLLLAPLMMDNEDAKCKEGEELLF